MQMEVYILQDIFGALLLFLELIGKNAQLDPSPPI
jgi:hypothetical protein